MAVHTTSNSLGDSGSKCLELGALDAEELTIFAELIDQRRPLPVFLGDAWRCDICTYESRDITAMEQHILAAHEPEPMNNADWEELLREEASSERLIQR